MSLFRIGIIIQVISWVIHISNGAWMIYLPNFPVIAAATVIAMAGIFITFSGVGK